MLPSDLIFNYLGHASYLGIFFLLIFINLFPVPEELIVLTIGYLAAVGTENIYLIMLVGIVALSVGDNILFWLSRKGSKYVLEFEEHIMQDKFEKYKNFMERHMGKAIFVFRFISGLRLLGPFLAGSMKTPWKKFQSFDLMALFIYVPLFVFLGKGFHEEISQLIVSIEALRHVSFVTLIIVLGILSKLFISDRVYGRRAKAKKG
ncbi:MAG: DedA family protein [Candidatus Pacebacteria bacterium]|nr:DedA family protein [Candidatus Paceibacterota bacterium]